MKDRIKRQSKCISLAVLLAIILAALWIFRPASSYDRSKVDERLSALVEPYKSVSTHYSQDGGTLAIEIIDAQDTALKILFPVFDFNTSYNKIYFGALRYSDIENAEEAQAKNIPETKLMVEDILHRYSTRNTAFALAMLRKRPGDYIKVIYHSLMGHYDPNRQPR
jgi:hypothetical protein